MKTAECLFRLLFFSKVKWRGKRKCDHLKTLVEFARAIERALTEINESCFTSFKLRIG